MKKLYIPLFLSLFLILSLLCGCFCLSHCAQHQVAELKKCTDTLPSAEEFDRIRKDPERTALLEEQLKNIESKTKRAEEKLALFINYNYLNTLSTAASALCKCFFHLLCQRQIIANFCGYKECRLSLSHINYGSLRKFVCMNI